MIPYKDFNIIQGPLVSLICGIFLKVFAEEMLVTRILAIILDSAIFLIMFKIMDRLKIKDYFKYIVLSVLAIIMMHYFTIDYNWMTLLFVLIIIYLELKESKSLKKHLIIGILAGFTFTIKQTTGLIIIAATIGINVLQIRSIEDFKKCIKPVLTRIFGAIGICIVYGLILFGLGALNDYIDYCILGISTFSNSISYIGRLIKNSNLLFRVLSLTPFIILPTLIITYIKFKKKEGLILLIYSLVLIVLIYPISDEIHFVVAIPGILISAGYLLNLLSIKLNIPIKEEIVANNFLQCAMVLISIIFFIHGIIIFSSKNINLELNHYKLLPMEENQIASIEVIDKFIKNQEKDVYILDSTAALYMIPIDRYNKDYDMFLKGNLGSKGEDGQNKNLKSKDNKIVLILNSNYRRNWQTPENVISYIIDNMKKTGEIGVFDIYE